MLELNVLLGNFLFIPKSWSSVRKNGHQLAFSIFNSCVSGTFRARGMLRILLSFSYQRVMGCSGFYRTRVKDLIDYTYVILRGTFFPVDGHHRFH